jgi:hypothetical protein
MRQHWQTTVRTPASSRDCASAALHSSPCKRRGPARAGSYSRRPDSSVHAEERQACVSTFAIGVDGIPFGSSHPARNGRRVEALFLERPGHNPGSNSRRTRTLSRVFEISGVPHAHAHRFRHTLATALLEQGWTTEDVADVLGSSPNIIRKHYAQWTTKRQQRVSEVARALWMTGFCQVLKKDL